MLRSNLLGLGLGLLALTAAAGFAGPASAQETIQPGYWEVNNKVEAVIRKSTQERRCITPAQVAKFNMGPANKHYTCTYPTRVFENGKIVLKGVCTDKNGKQAQVAATGSYSPSTFQMTADVDATYAGVPISAKFFTDARRLGDVCPPGAKSG
jgi:hypothetical protein